MGRFKLTPNGQVLPMVGDFIFVRPQLLPGFLIKLTNRTNVWLCPSKPLLHRIPKAYCFSVTPTFGNTNVGR